MIWRLTYCNKKGVEAQVDIIKGDRSTVETVDGSGNPFTISYRLDKNDKSGHIMTSSADIEFFETETFNIDDLKTSNETELKVEYFEKNILTWSGFILPDFFSKEIGSPSIVRMTASDRLTALKGVTLSDLSSRISLRNLIELSLAQTGLSLALVAQIQINQGSTNILDSEILSQRLTDVRGRSISCYDILMSIMVATNSTIRQRVGQWVVYNKLEHELRTPTIFFDKVERGAIRTIQPVASSVGVYHEFGGNRLHPNNYDFSDGLTNWTPRNGFEAYIDNRVVSYFLGGTPIYQPDATTNDYLVNLNDWTTNETNLDTAPFLESNNIPISSTQDNTVEVEVDISAVMAEKLSSNTAISFLRYAIIATNGVDTYALTPNGAFETYDPEKIDEHSIVLRGGQQPPLFLASPAYANSSKRKGVLDVNNVNDFHINIRIYGSGLFQYVNVNFASIKFGNKTETPKGNLYKTTQGSNFTKLHDVETVIFGDYIRSGLNGYFYNYPIDDTSNLYLPSGELSPPEWNTIFDTTERPLLHHISRQKSRLFSVAHDILKANINVESFDPLAVFQDCKGGKYVVVSANFDFLRSEVDVELEQIAYDNTILKRDFVYSYFGEGEPGIKSIGGISGGSGGGSGGGMTADQAAILSEVQDLAHEHGNKGVLDQVTQEVVDKALREILTTESEEEATDENLMSALRVLREITESSIGLDDKYLSKKDDDTAAGHITLNDGFTSKSHSYIEAPLDVDKKLTAKEGLQIGASFAGGFTGHGGLINEHGDAELQSLILRTFLEVPELRFNRIDVIAGDLWNTKGAGIIEEVDTVNQIITLKLEKGDIGRFRYDDIVMGIFHSFNDEDNSVDSYDDGIGNRRYSGFATSYFRVTQILDAEYYSKFRYELRPTSPRYPKQFHPQPFMTSAQYGNFTNAERQTSMYQTTSYIRLLRNVNNWEFGIENIGMQWGDLNNLSIFGLDMTGYSAYMENVYFSGIIHQLSAKIKEQLDAQRVGGKNLLREYDIRFGFKYWGNAGEYTEFDMNLIESTPQLQVQPNTLNWTFPIRYGTVAVNANGVWNITTPNWVNAFPAVGSGNKNVDLKANEYKGRDARTGIVAIQSGVIQRNVSISQAGLTEFVTIDPILNVGYGAQTVTITGKSNSRKLTFTTDTGYLEINLPAQYKVNGANVSNGSLIAGDPGALDEYNFSITVAVGENVEEFSIQNNIFATAEGGQKAISTIVQRRTRIKVLADADNSIISIGDMIFYIN